VASVLSSNNLRTITDNSELLSHGILLFLCVKFFGQQKEQNLNLTNITAIQYWIPYIHILACADKYSLSVQIYTGHSVLGVHSSYLTCYTLQWFNYVVGKD